MSGPPFFFCDWVLTVTHIVHNLCPITTTHMITEITKKQTSGINKILPSLTVEQIEILNLHCEKVKAAYDLTRSTQRTPAYWPAYKAYIAARAQRTKALRKAGFPSFCAGSSDHIIF